jgi:DNA repair protein SbcD/Mre11
MGTISFIHTADLHLDTPFKGLSNENPELATRLKNATLKTFHRIVELCISEQVDFLLISGDIFDGEMQSLAAQLRLAEELKKLYAAGIPAYIVTGNHDPLVSWISELKMPVGVFRFDAQQVKKERFEKQGNPTVDIYGISFETRSVEMNLAKEFVIQEPRADFSIALLHGSIGSSQHYPYAPFSMDDIRNKGFDYWALGHVHKKEIIHPAYPAVVYPGNPQGRDFGETGARGCFKVTLSTSKAPDIVFIPTQTIRFEEITLNVSGAETINDLNDLMQGIAIDDYVPSSGYLLRVKLVGRTPLHHLINNNRETEKMAALYNESQLHTGIIIDKITCSTLPDADLEELKKGNDFTAEILNEFDSYSANAELLENALEDIESEFTSGAARNELEPLTHEEKQEILARAQWMLIDQLLKE